MHGASLGHLRLVAAGPGPAVPADDDPPPARAEAGRRLSLDRTAFRVRQPPPRLHRQHRARPPPRPGDLAVDEQRARPDARRPERALAVRVRDQQIPVGPLEQETRRRWGAAAPPAVGRARCGRLPRPRGGSTPRRRASVPVRATRPAPEGRVSGRGRSRPAPEGVRRRRSVAAQVAPGELEARLAGLMSGAGTVQTIGCRAPSHRIRTVPVAAAYLRRLGFTPSRLPASP